MPGDPSEKDYTSSPSDTDWEKVWLIVGIISSVIIILAIASCCPKKNTANTASDEARRNIDSGLEGIELSDRERIIRRNDEIARAARRHF